MSDTPYRCSDASLARAETLYGTASNVRRWLLVEQPGRWGPDAISDSRLPAAIAAELRHRAAAASVRIVLLRRGARISGDKRRCFFLRADERDPYIAQLDLDKVDDLLDIDLSPLREGGEIGAARTRDEPLFLVCTHGRHDACCSIRGNQVSRIACAEPGMDAWECSHIGGDRFAANLVCFPHGLYYGRVGPDEVTRLMADFCNGTISLDHYRGRCCYPFPLQAAEYFVRRATGNLGLDEVTLVGSNRTTDAATATFDVNGTAVDVEVRIATGPDVYRLTCGSEEDRTIPRYELVSCTLASG